MALTEVALNMLKEVLRKSRSILSLGYPDIVVKKYLLEASFGIELSKSNPEAEYARLQHGVDYDLPDTEEFFEKLKVRKFDCCDLKALRGNEIVADLNLPQNFDQYDLVIDPGTLEHCFNIAQAALNAANAVKLGGFIFHDNPLSMVNHGFYMLSPTWYYDFYTDNGWEIVSQVVTNHVNGVIEVDPVARVKAMAELSNMVLVRKTNEAPMKWPVQSKYKRMLN
jgi:hypothetical protein